MEYRGREKVQIDEMDTDFNDDYEDKYKRTRRLCLISAFLLALSLIAIIVFICLVTGVIPAGQASDEKTRTIITKESFGKIDDGTEIERYTLRNSYGTEIQMITYGATITSIRTANKDGKFHDIVLGFDNIAGYLNPGNPYFGSAVGRFANRIARGTFTLNGETYQLNINNGPNTLHGGNKGWDKAVWKATQTTNSVIFSHESPGGDENYPGHVSVNITVSLSEHNEMAVRFLAETKEKDTPINLTYHPYFNLAGEGTGTVHDHVVTIHADKYTPSDTNLIPTGSITSVDGSVFDLRKPTTLGDVINDIPGTGHGGGFDHNFCVNGPTGRKFAARVSHPASGRVMEIYTNQPGMQFYTGNFLDGTLGGKSGHTYPKHAGFCMETQNYPDSPNQNNFPDPYLRQGATYDHQVWYKFFAE